LRGNARSARKVPKGQTSWKKVRARKGARESSETYGERKRDEPLIPDWMKVKKVVVIFILLFLCLTTLAFFIDASRYAFPIAGIVILVGGYVLGGGLSEWSSFSGGTTIGARSSLKYRYGESASNWDVIIVSFVIGGLVFLSGLIAILLDQLI
jgi:hypothetical protein